MKSSVSKLYDGINISPKGAYFAAPAFANTISTLPFSRNVTGVQGDVSNLGDLDRLFTQINSIFGTISARIEQYDAVEERRRPLSSFVVAFADGKDFDHPNAPQ